MKTLSKKIMLMMSLFLASVAFTACSSSDDDGGSNGDNIGNNGSITPLWPAYSAPFDRWGYINEDGEMVIAPQFKMASMFGFDNGNLAAAQMEDNRICFIDTKGNIQKISPFAVENLVSIEELSNDNIIIIRTEEGAELLNSNLEYVLQPNSDLDFSYITEDGLIYCRKSGKLGCINTNGETVIDFKFEEIGSFHDGIAPAEMNNKWGLIDRNGNYVAEAKYNYIDYITDNRYRIRIDQYYNVGRPDSYSRSAYGIIDGTGKEIAPVTYSDLSTNVSANGWIVARSKNNNLYGCIDTNGKTVLDFKFEEVGSFHDGLAPACMNHRWGLIDYNGNYVLEAKYGGIEYIANNTYRFQVGNGYMPDGSFYPYYKPVYGIMDSTGKEIVPATYSFLSGISTNGWIIACPKDKNLYGCIDTNGNKVLDFKYNNIRFSDDKIEVTNEDGTRQTIDKAGNILTTLEENEYIVVAVEDRDFFLYCKYDENGITLRYVKSGKTVYSWTK